MRTAFPPATQSTCPQLRKPPAANRFAALFEECLHAQGNAHRRSDHRRSRPRRRTTSWSSTPASSPKLHPDRRIQERPRRTRSQGRRLRLASPSTRSKTATATPSCRATRPSASPRGSSSRRRSSPASSSPAPINGKVKGGLTVMVNGIRAFLPGSLVDTASGQGHDAVRRQDDGVQGHQARPQAQQRGACRAAPWSKRPMGEERAASCSRRCRKAPSSRASSRTSPTTARSSTSAASTACCTSPTWPGAA